MSGRLVILRHKKWNVWNRENIEKVKRDERLNREEIEAKKLNERKLNSESILERIHQETSENPEEEKNSEGKDDRQQKRVKFIDYSSVENEEYKKEKEEKELLMKRREGSAPWALGDGSSEFNKVSPWYMEKQKEKEKNKIRIGGKVLTGEQAQAALDRDIARKRFEDPMSIYLHSAECKEDENDIFPNQVVLQESSSNLNITSLQTTNSVLPGMANFNTFVLGKTMIMTPPSPHDNNEKQSNDKKRKNSKHHKKHKKDKKSKREKKRTDSKRGKHQTKRGDGSSSSSSSSPSSSSSESESESHSSAYQNSLSKHDFEQLRNKRTEREQVERQRQQKLLSNRL